MWDFLKISFLFILAHQAIVNRKHLNNVYPLVIIWTKLESKYDIPACYSLVKFSVNG